MNWRQLSRSALVLMLASAMACAPYPAEELEEAAELGVSQAANSSCRLYDNNLPACNQAGCAYYSCSQQCHPQGTSYCNANCSEYCLPLNSIYSAQTVPSTVTAGDTFWVQIRMRNLGYVTWTSASNIKLGSQSPQDNSTWGTGRINLSPTDSIVQGTEKAFSAELTAPTTPGTYAFQWRMLQEGIAWFGATTPLVYITVQPPPPACKPCPEGQVCPDSCEIEM